MRPVTDIQRRVAPFKVESEYQPAGDQPKAIAELSQRVNAGEKDIVLLGATGTGKTKTLHLMAEQLATNGVPVFMADIKGDLSGLAEPGESNDKVAQRASDVGQAWEAKGF